MNLSSKQLQAVVKLSQGKTARKTAEELEVTAQTLTEWNKIPEFEITLNSLKLEIITSGRDSIRAVSSLAVECLKSLVESGKNEEVRRKAANDILTMAGIADPNDGRIMWGIGPTSMPEFQSKKGIRSVS